MVDPKSFAIASAASFRWTFARRVDPLARSSRDGRPGEVTPMTSTWFDRGSVLLTGATQLCDRGGCQMGIEFVSVIGFALGSSGKAMRVLVAAELDLRLGRVATISVRT
jgi:hypothetical protein